MTTWNPNTAFIQDEDVRTVDRRRTVRSAPVVDGTALWIEEDSQIQVEVIDESPGGLGVVVPADTSFEFKSVVYIDYQQERRSAKIAHLTRRDDGSFRLGLTWN